VREVVRVSVRHVVHISILNGSFLLFEGVDVVLFCFNFIQVIRLESWSIPRNLRNVGVHILVSSWIRIMVVVEFVKSLDLWHA